MPESDGFDSCYDGQLQVLAARQSTAVLQSTGHCVNFDIFTCLIAPG